MKRPPTAGTYPWHGQSRARIRTARSPSTSQDSSSFAEKSLPERRGDKCECEHQPAGRVDLDDPKPGEMEGNRIRFEDRGGSLYPGGLPHGRTYSYQVAAVTKRDYKGKTSKAVLVALTLPPGQPTGLSAAPGEDTAALKWTPPATEEGRAAVSGYLVYRSSEKYAREVLVSPEPVREPAFTDIHLSPGLSYTYSVAAVAGRGPRGTRASGPHPSP